MADTLFKLTYNIARVLGQVTEGEATGGTTTTLIDTVDRTEADDAWNGGTVWILDDAGGASAAPEGEYAIVTDFANTSKTATFAALTTAPAVGDRYGISKKRFPLYTIIQKVNEALSTLGDMEYVDTTTITTASAQTEYNLPTTASMNLKQVWFQGKTGDANDNRWVELHDWRQQKTATGTADLLVFPYQLSTGRSLMLVYNAPHPQMFDYGDKLDERIHPDLVVYEAAAKCVFWRMQKEGFGDETLRAQYQQLQNDAQMARLNHPVSRAMGVVKPFIAVRRAPSTQFTYPD